MSTVLMSAGLKPNTHRTYNSAQNRYLNFCCLYDLVATPTTEDVLLLYVAFLFDDNLKGSSIRVYLAAVRSLHVFWGLPYPVETLRLRLAVKGAITQSPPPVRKLPITFDVLCSMLHCMTDRFDFKMLSAAMTLAFFGCFRSGEICVVNQSLFDCKVNLCMEDVLVDREQRMLSIFLKKSKNDYVSKGVSVFVGCSKKKVCGYCSVVEYIDSLSCHAILPTAPFFRDAMGLPLSKDYFVSATRLSLALAGHDPMLFSGHSFRAGAATTAGDQGFDDWEIKMLGRWNSSAYSIYLRNPKVVSTFASRLAI